MADRDESTYATTAEEDSRRTAQVIGSALRRMRLIAAALLFMQFATYRPAPGDPTLPASGPVVGLLLASLAGLISLVSLAAERSVNPRRQAVLSLIEISADAALVLALATALDVTGRDVMWVLLVVPVLEGALRYRLRGAMAVWALVSIAYLALQVRGATGSEDELLAIVDLSVQHVGVILLVTIPAGFLSEQLLIGIRAQRNAWELAAHRGELLETVAEAGHRVTSLEVEVVRAVTSSALALGFDTADLALQRPSGEWFVTGAQSKGGETLPAPEQPAGGAVAASQTHRTMVTDQASDVAEERADLEALGLAVVVASPLHALSGGASLRAGVGAGAEVTNAQLECLELLAAQAGVAMRNGQLVSEQRAMRDQLEHRAFHDGLTGLPNRARFLQRLEESVTRPAPAHEQAAVLFIDLDRFKPVNDSLGHDAGNELLVAVGRRLAGNVGAKDIVGRLGGDEFVVLLDTVATAEDATEVAERLCRALNEPFVVASHEVAISASVGIAMATRPFSDPGELVRRADQAMYRAKASGRARWSLYEPGHDTASISRLQLEADLRTALQRDQLSLVYQPVYRAYDQSMVAVEALVRWEHPSHGTIAPSTLIPIAEESGQILDLGRWVLRRATQAHQEWRRTPLGGTLTLAVNVSPIQLSHPGFAADIDRILGESAMPPSSLLLEVTENVVSIGTDLIALMRGLRARGIHLALDDFGQGQTSLRHLRELPLDVLKIDKVFVDRLAEEGPDRAIVRSIIGLAHELGLRVIAEGIENEEQLQLLRTYRTDLVQGYLLHRPTGPDQITVLLGGVQAAPLRGRVPTGARA